MNKLKIGSLVVTIICSIVVFIYLMIKFRNKIKLKKGYQYIYNPKDITTQKDSPKTQSFNNIKECIEVCEDNPYCTGLTYNSLNNKCTMISRGVLVQGKENHVAWQKDNISQAFLLESLISKNPKNNQSVPYKNLLKGLSNKFCICFHLNIIDFYDSITNNPNKQNDFQVWKHILHKGILNQDKKIIESDKWEDIVDNRYDGSIYSQDIGFWLAPYTNNIRICFTVNNLTEDMNEKNDTIINNIQYIDIRNVPINEKFFIAVNVNDRVIEVFINNKIHTISVLSGSVNISDQDIHIKYKPFFQGEIHNLHFIPEYASFDKIINLSNHN